MERLPFSFCAHPLTRTNSKLSSVSHGTLMQYMQCTHAYVEEAIKRLLPDTFGLVLDGWTDAGRHYVAIFAVFNDPSTGGISTGNPGSRADYYDDLDCPTRRYVLHAFAPLDNEEDLGAQSLFGMMADTLSRYDRPWEHVAFMVGDNCSVNQCISRRVGAVPMVGCASHRFNLTVKEHLKEDPDDKDILEKIQLLMKKLSTLRGHAVLWRVSDLAPMQRSDTRWSSVYAMVERYKKLEEVLRTLDHGTVDEFDLGSFFLTWRENERAVKILADLEKFEAVTKTLQRYGLTMSAVRRLFDEVVKTYPEMKNRLSSSAPLINKQSLENGLVKIQRREALSAAERTECARFRAAEQAAGQAVNDTEEHDSIVRDAFKGRRVTKRVSYIDVGFVPPTSNECERFFSVAKLQFSDLRKSMLPETLEMVMMLMYNRDLWDVYTVESVRHDMRH